MPATAGKFGLTDITTPSGRQKTESTEDQDAAAQLTADIAKQLFESTAGLRGLGVSGLEGFLMNGQLPTGLDVGLDRLMTTGREGLEGQYNVARENILGRIPNRGGQMNEALNTLETSRAGAVGRLGADVLAQYELPMRMQLFNTGISTGFGAPSQSMAGLLGASGQFGNIATRAQMEQLEREKRSKEEMQEMGKMMGGGK